METESGFIIEWRIENFSQWCREVHGNCIKSPKGMYYFHFWELFPKGISGQGEHIEVRLLSACYSYFPLYGEISFLASDGSQLCLQEKFHIPIDYSRLYKGPKLEDVCSRIRDSDDAMTVKFRFMESGNRGEQHICTTVNCLKLSLKLNSQLFKKMNVKRDFIRVQLSSQCVFDVLTCYSEKNILSFTIQGLHAIESPIAVEMCMRTSDLLEKTGNCMKEEHLFIKESEWKFPHSLAVKDIAEKRGSLLIDLKFKTSFVVHDHYYYVCDSSMISVKHSNHNRSSEDGSSTSSEISNEVGYTRGRLEDTMTTLTTDLMCLYQDQKFSDLTLNCGDITFPVHKAILSARSPVFETMLSIDMKESSSGRVDITDLDPSTLGLFLTFLYTGAVGEEGMQSESAIKLYYAADKYQVLSLKRECTDFLYVNVSILNVCDILSLADRHQDVKLSSATRGFILDNFDDVMKSKEWTIFLCEEPLLAAKTVTSFAVEGSVRKHKQVSK